MSIGFRRSKQHPVSKFCVEMCYVINCLCYFKVRHLCQDWFPIDYPDSWYKDITSDPRFYSLAAIYGGVIIGLVVAEIKAYVKLNREVSSILSNIHDIHNILLPNIMQINFYRHGYCVTQVYNLWLFFRKFFGVYMHSRIPRLFCVQL